MGAFGLFLRGPCWEYHFRYWAGVSKKPSWSGCKQPAGPSSSQNQVTCTLVCQDCQLPSRRLKTAIARRCANLEGSGMSTRGSA